MSFRLRYLDHDLELRPGEFLIGRSEECHLSLDDPLVSRRHAMLVVTEGSIEVRDLGSRNGVLINDRLIAGEGQIDDGDTLTIGNQRLTLYRRGHRRPTEAPPASFRRKSATLAHMPAVVVEPHSSPNSGDVSKRIDSLQLLGALADKALALGKYEEAERILASALFDTLEAMRRGQPVPATTIELAGRYATKLAGAGRKGSWIDYVVKLYGSVERPFPAAIIDELHLALRKVGPIDLKAFRLYLGRLRDAAPSFGPAERFLLQRIEGLERFASLR